jgi:hypothetical protein
MSDYEIEEVAFTPVEYREGKFKLNNNIFDSPEGITSGVYQVGEILLVVANAKLWMYGILDYNKICDVDSTGNACRIFSDSLRLYIWVGNIYMSIKNEHTITKCTEDYFNKCFGPWYFYNGVWKHIISQKTVFGGYDVEYATYSVIETVQVNNSIISEAVVKLSHIMNRRRIVEICREYFKTDDHNAALVAFELEFKFP